jgi:phage tail-like protein
MRKMSIGLIAALLAALAASPAAAVRETDPVNSYRFEVWADGGVESHFFAAEAFGLNNQDPGVIVFRKGLSQDMGPWQWRELALLFGPDAARGALSVVLYDNQHQPIAGWIIEEAWPSMITGPTIDAGSGNFAFEELRIRHGGMVAAWGEREAVPMYAGPLLSVPLKVLEKVDLDARLPAVAPKGP